jgi:hypothetical protein
MLHAVVGLAKFSIQVHHTHEKGYYFGKKKTNKRTDEQMNERRKKEN